MNLLLLFIMVCIIVPNAFIYAIIRYMEITTIIDNQLLSASGFCIVISRIGIKKIMISICIVDARQFGLIAGWPTKFSTAKQYNSINWEKQ